MPRQPALRRTGLRMHSALNREFSASAMALMLLYCATHQASSFAEVASAMSEVVEGWQEVVDLASEVALQTTDDLAFGQTLGGASGDVGDGRFVPAHPNNDGP